MFGTPKPPPPASFETLQAQLTAIPIPNEHVEKDDRGDVMLITVDLRYGALGKALAKPLKLRDKKSYQVDGVSLEIYRLLDGKKTVEHLVELLAEKHKLTFFESRGLILQYLHILTQKGVIVVGGSEDSPS